MILIREKLCGLGDVPWLWPAKIQFLLDENVRLKRAENEIREKMRAEDDSRRAVERGRPEDAAREMMRRSAAINQRIRGKG